MTLSDISYSEKMDFFRQTSYLAYQYLSYRFYERFKDLLILLSEEKTSGGLRDLKAIADKESIQYILNFPKTDLYKADGAAYAKLRVQLYDNLTGEYLINKDFEGNWRNPGFEFSCPDKTIHCTVNNALSSALSEVIEAIATNSPTLKRERLVSQQRYDQLVTNHLSKPCDVETLKTIVQESSDLQLDHVFQVLYDEQKTKFVAFSVEQVSAQDLKTLSDNKKDQNVKIISGKDIKDEGFLKNIPRTYAFIIKGVKYKDKWYYEKAKATYFEASTPEEGRRVFFNNLQEWNFFIENSAMVSPNFWETGLFGKIRDLRQDPDWEKYGDSSWQSEEANNRDYVGMYEIVADGIRRAKREEHEKFKEITKESKLKPVYEQLKSRNPKDYSKYSDQYLIFPGDRRVAISPVLVTNDKDIMTVHYFVVFGNSNEVFEWTYFSPEEVKSYGFYGGTVFGQLKTVTKWNFSYDTLDDKDFWDKYVLQKEGDKFKYLKKVQL
ncbi:MAG TPA: hypothetical protein VIU12_32685 [Chryseolinea sp.]